MTGPETTGLTIVIVAFLAGPIGRAIGRRIAGTVTGSGTTDEAGTARLAELEHRLLDLETAQARMTELEERLDFAERMLARPEADPERALPVRPAHG